MRGKGKSSYLYFRVDLLPFFVWGSLSKLTILFFGVYQNSRYFGGIVRSIKEFSAVKLILLQFFLEQNLGPILGPRTEHRNRKHTRFLITQSLIRYCQSEQNTFI